MSNSDASIDPLLRSIASATSNFHSGSPIVNTHANSFPQNLDYDQSPLSSSYLQSRHLQDDAQQTSTVVDGTLHDDSGLSDPKRSRACEACRGLKVKCEPNQTSQDAPCKRCAKANRLCIVTAPSRKRRKKTDSRVAELERKIDALTASLAAQRAGIMPIPHHGENEYVQESLPLPSNPRPSSFQQVVNETYSSPFTDGSEIHGDEWDGSHKSEVEQKPIVTPKIVIDLKRKHYETYATRSGSPISTFNPSNNRTEPSGILLDSTTKTVSASGYIDVIDRGLITSEVATKIFDNFIGNMISKLPLLAFPSGITCASVRKSTPIVFLAILGASSGMSFPHFQQTFTNEIMSIYAERIIYNGERSLELIQAIQITTLWYFLPEQFGEVKIYQLIHIASVMAIEMGLGRRNMLPKSKVATVLANDHVWKRSRYPNPESIEARRAWLACYWLCCNASMAIRRQNFIRWSPFIADCVDVLEKSPDALPSDKILSLWVKNQHIAEEVTIKFSMDDPSALASISDAKVRCSLKNFERDLEKWKIDSESKNMSPLLIFAENVVNLYMHEVAMHVDHNMDEFVPFFTEDNLRPSIEEGDHLNLSSTRVNSLSICLNSIDGIFETFISLDTEGIRSLPFPYFGWVAYAIVVLIKMYFAAAISNSEIGKIIDKDNIKLEQYLDRLEEVLRVTSAEDRSRPSLKLMMVVTRLKIWLHSQWEQNSSKQVTPIGSSTTSQRDRPKEKFTGNKPRKTSLSSTKQSDYSPANTPLQLLSEVATGNSQRQSILIDKLSYSGSMNEWQHSSSHPASHFGGTIPQSHEKVGVNGNIDPSLGLDMEYTVGDVLEQLMNIKSLGIENFGPILGENTLFGRIMNSPIVSNNLNFDGI